jgi:hypothetical protein
VEAESDHWSGDELLVFVDGQYQLMRAPRPRGIFLSDAVTGHQASDDSKTAIEATTLYRRH